MVSTMERDMVIKDGKVSFPFKELPDWYGVPNVGFIYHNSWVDPELEYDGKRVNSVGIEDAMWNEFQDECAINDDELDDFGEYLREHADEVYELINESEESNYANAD